MGFIQSEFEPCVYIRKDGKKIVIIAVYVDDFFIFFNDKIQVKKLKCILNDNFCTKDLSQVTECLSMKVTITKDYIKLDQKGYCERLLQKFGMMDCVSVKTPMECGLILSKKTEFAKDIPYQQAVGGLLYLSLCTRPDIAFAVNYLSQFNNCYGKEHWNAVLRIFRYLKGSMDYGIVYSKSDMYLLGYCDAAFANLEEIKSVSGYLFKMSYGKAESENLSH